MSRRPLLRVDGSSFEADVRVIPVRYRGEPHVLSVVRDITERKQAEAALQLREEQYRAIFDGADRRDGAVEPRHPHRRCQSRPPR